MTMLTAKETEVYECLKMAAESNHGDGWSQVYLDNARPPSMPNRTFSALLGNLEKKGLYRSQGDDCFGDVKTNA